ncbi:MAG: recombinase zinc beta ribbon domain-containing protein [Myxococcota bacterium]
MRELFKRYLTGTVSVHDLYFAARDELNLRTRGSRRHPAGPISVSYLYAMLQKPFYAGLIKHGGEVYVGEHEAMVTKAEFERIQVLLGRVDAPRPSKHAFTYAGLLRCGACGRAVVGEDHVNRYGTKYTYYRCGRRKVGSITCPERYVTEREVHAQVAACLRDLTVPAWLVAWTRRWLEAEREERLTRIRATTENLRKQVASKEQELTRLTTLCARGHLSEDEYVSARIRALGELEDLQHRSSDPSGTETEADANLMTALEAAASAAETFDSGDRDRQRELLADLCEGITVQQRQVTVRLRYPFGRLRGAWSGQPAPRDANPPETDENPLNGASEVLGTRGKGGGGDGSGFGGDANPRLALVGNEKSQGLSPQLLSWCSVMKDVRISTEELLSSPGIDGNGVMC